MKKQFVLPLLLLTLLTGKLSAQTSQTVGPEKGALVIVGGGSMSPELWNRFIELAGGPAKASIVIIPTAGEDSSANSTPRE